MMEQAGFDWQIFCVRNDFEKEVLWEKRQIPDVLYAWN